MFSRQTFQSQTPRKFLMVQTVLYKTLNVSGFSLLCFSNVKLELHFFILTQDDVQLNIIAHTDEQRIVPESDAFTLSYSSSLFWFNILCFHIPPAQHHQTFS